MALTMRSIGCSSSFTSGASLIGVRGSPSPCRRARNFSPRSSLSQQGEDECSLSKVDYEDVATQWLSADFLDLRLRSSGLVCNEAIQALRKHFQKNNEQPAATAADVKSGTAIQQVVEQAAPKACQVKTRPLPKVIVFDEALFPQLYSSSSTYTTMCSFLDESFC